MTINVDNVWAMTNGETRDANGVLRKRWDDTARTYTEWDANGVQTSTRPFTPNENARADEAAAAEALDTNKRTIEERAADAITANRDYLDIAAPSNAQVVAQVKALTRQVSGLIRLTINQLDEVE